MMAKKDWTIDIVYYQKGYEVKGDDYFDKVDVCSKYIENIIPEGIRGQGR